jgi:hypothetical protein
MTDMRWRICAFQMVLAADTLTAMVSDFMHGLLNSEANNFPFRLSVRPSVLRWKVTTTQSSLIMSHRRLIHFRRIASKVSGNLDEISDVRRGAVQYLRIETKAHTSLLL